MKNYVAYIQYNKEKNWYHGVVPGVHGAEATGHSLEELKANLRRAVNRSMKERKRAREAAKPAARYPGHRRINIEV